jgi:hypothetical protein
VSTDLDDDPRLGYVVTHCYSTLSYKNRGERVQSSVSGGIWVQSNARMEHTS